MIASPSGDSGTSELNAGTRLAQWGAGMMRPLALKLAVTLPLLAFAMQGCGLLGDKDRQVPAKLQQKQSACMDQIEPVLREITTQSKATLLNSIECLQGTVD